MLILQNKSLNQRGIYRVYQLFNTIIPTVYGQDIKNFYFTFYDYLRLHLLIEILIELILVY